MLTIKKKSARAVLLATCVAVAVYIDGFFALLFHLGDAGAFNPAVAIVIGSLLLGMLAFSRRVSTWVAIVLIMDSVILIFVDYQGNSYFVKLTRDYLYLIILIISFSIFSGYVSRHIIDLRGYVLSLAILVILIFPLIGFVTGVRGYDNRFAGFMLSPPIFANSVLLVYLIYRNSCFKVSSTLVFFCLAITFIFLSGTRSPLLTLLLYEMLLFGSGEMVKRNKLIYFLVIAVAGVLAAGVAADLYVSMASAHTQSRIFAQQDSDGGSLQTRSTWYLEIVESLARDHYLGGFGAGAAEHLTGYITHFDILRYWYDYSFAYVFVFFFAIFKMHEVSLRNRIGNSNIYAFLAFPFVMFNVVLVSMHNIFQTPGLIVLFANYLLFSVPRAID